MTTQALEQAQRVQDNYAMIQSRANMIVESANLKIYIALHAQGFAQQDREELEREIWRRLRTMADEYIAGN